MALNKLYYNKCYVNIIAIFSSKPLYVAKNDYLYYFRLKECEVNSCRNNRIMYDIANIAYLVDRSPSSSGQNEVKLLIICTSD